MTPARRPLRASRRRSVRSSGWAVPCALSAAIVAITPATPLAAQGRGETPIAPAATIGTVTDTPALSVLGMASVPGGSGGAFAQQNDLWFGATQPLGRFGGAHFTALGRGNWRVRDVAGTDAQAQGMVSLRARARLGTQRIWSAVSYGYAGSNGVPGANLLGDLSGAQAGGGRDTRGSDTTVSRRIDVGQIGRAEAGLVNTFAGIEFAFGMSVERATRFTTQTITVDEPSQLRATSAGAGRLVSSHSVRTMQRRDLATGIASVGFNTGATTWLLSVTAPVAQWISADELAPAVQAIPTVASLAVVQPVTGWLSLVGAAASNAATVGPNALQDQVNRPEGHGNRSFSPVVALGIRISRLPGRDHDGTPGGILTFETRTLGTVDSLSIEQGSLDRDHDETDTLRVVLLIDAPRAESVELMGDATAWTVTQMRRHPSGRWRAELKLAPGMHRLIVRSDGGKWVAPPGLPVGNDDYGTPVGMVLIRSPRH